MANDICLKLINLLEKNNEEYIDEFPIYIQNGKYYYSKVIMCNCNDMQQLRTYN